MLYTIKDYLFHTHKISKELKDSSNPFQNIDLSKYLVTHTAATASSKLRLVSITDKALEKKVSKVAERTLTLDKFLKSKENQDLDSIYVDTGPKRLGQKKSALFTAINQNNLELVKELYELGGVDERYDHSMPPVFLALKHGRTEMVDFMISYRPEDIDLIWENIGCGIDQHKQNPFINLSTHLFLQASDSQAGLLDWLFEKNHKKWKKEIFQVFLSFSSYSFETNKLSDKELLSSLKWFYEKDPELLKKFKNEFLDYARVPLSMGKDIRNAYQTHNLHKELSGETDKLKARLLPAVKILTSSVLFKNKKVMEWVQSIDPSFYQEFMTDIPDSYFHQVLVRDVENNQFLKVQLEDFSQLKKYVSKDNLIAFCNFSQIHQRKGKKNSFDLAFAKELEKMCKSDTAPTIEFTEKFLDFVIEKDEKELWDWLIGTNYLFELLDNAFYIIRKKPEALSLFFKYPEFLSLISIGETSPIIQYFKTEKFRQNPASGRVIQDFQKKHKEISEHIKIQKISEKPVFGEELIDSYNQKIIYPGGDEENASKFTHLSQLFSSLSYADFHQNLHLGAGRTFSAEEVQEYRDRKLERVNSFIENIKNEKVDVAVPAGLEKKYYLYLKNILFHLGDYLEERKLQKEELFTFLEDLTSSAGACYVNFSARLLSIYKRIGPSEEVVEKIQFEQPEDVFKERFTEFYSKTIKRFLSQFLFNQDVHISAFYKEIFERRGLPHVDIPIVADREIFRRGVLRKLFSESKMDYDEVKPVGELEKEFEEKFINKFRSGFFSLSALTKIIRKCVEVHLQAGNSGEFCQFLVDYIESRRSSADIDPKYLDSHEILEFDEETSVTRLKEKGEFVILAALLSDKNVTIKS